MGLDDTGRIPIHTGFIHTGSMGSPLAVPHGSTILAHLAGEQGRRSRAVRLGHPAMPRPDRHPEMEGRVYLTS